MNIIKGNKLISKFMGYRYYPFDFKLKKEKNYNFLGWRKGRPSLPTGNLKIKIGSTHYIGRRHKDLKFHEDWNWLMDVINHIKKQYLNKQFNDIEKSLLTLDIEKVWSSVVVFIENEENKKLL